MPTANTDTPLIEEKCSCLKAALNNFIQIPDDPTIRSSETQRSPVTSTPATYKIRGPIRPEESLIQHQPPARYSAHHRDSLIPEISILYPTRLTNSSMDLSTQKILIDVLRQPSVPLHNVSSLDKLHSIEH
ncbi:unnamed protein product [Orchesella dallaii]|uniref:Uncharacterized protein n=1 Tax=Orchesella dallaii TaxID=48710 RepID=A0ABP1Q351_9HEXA